MKLLLVMVSVFFAAQSLASTTLVECNFPHDKFDTIKISQSDRGFRFTSLISKKEGKIKMVESFKTTSNELEMPYFSVFKVDGQEYQLMNYLGEFEAATDRWDLVRKDTKLTESDEKNFGEKFNLYEIDNVHMGISVIFHDLNCK